MAVDWIGFAYAALLAVGGVVGYTRKGSKISLAAGLTFGSVAGYGAYCITRDPRNVKISLWKPLWVSLVQFKALIKNNTKLHQVLYFLNGLQLPVNQGFKLETWPSSETTQLCTLSTDFQGDCYTLKKHCESLYSTTIQGAKGKTANRSRIVRLGSQLAKFKQENVNTHTHTHKLKYPERKNKAPEQTVSW
nr:transmembrane protein 14A isoform X1 [Columba livia]